jgi:predicted HD superfamily hydrolase involved in NAD metabolism
MGGRLMKMREEWLAQLTARYENTGDLAEDVARFLTVNGHSHTAAHCASVAQEAARLAASFGVDTGLAAQAGWLHDISAVIPNEQRISAAQTWGLEVLPEEESFPMIIHQKLSVVVARELFPMTDDAVLSAIGCHTTLKANASALDKVLFVADKVRWDQTGVPPYFDELQAALTVSLDGAVLCYLQYLWERRHTLRVVHPWLVDAYRQLS